MPRISIVIPSYNHDRFIDRAIQSALNQTYQDMEILITDDGSNDRSISIIKEFSDPRIQLTCFHTNRGASTAMNHCIKHASGEFIAVLNSDDEFLPDKLAQQVSFLDEHPDIGAVFSYATIIDENNHEVEDEGHFYKRVFVQENRTRFAWLKRFFFQGNCLCHPSVLIRKECYDNVGLYDERLAHVPDLDFWIRLCAMYDIHIIPENLVRFRIHRDETNASGYRPEVIKRSGVEIAQILKNYLSSQITNHFREIFLTSDENDIFDTELVPYYIARLALQQDHVAYQYFGIDTLYRVFSLPEIVQKIAEKHQMHFADLLQITGQHDVLSTYKIEQLRHQFHDTQNRLEHKAAHLNNIVSERDQTISHLTTRLAERDQVVVSTTASVTERDQTISHLTTRLAERDHTVDDMIVHLNRQDQIIAELQTKAAEQHNTIENLRNSRSARFARKVRFYLNRVKALIPLRRP
ncbi:MAG: glycosyltransferase [Chloroflexota bacterium]